MTWKGCAKTLSYTHKRSYHRYYWPPSPQPSTYRLHPRVRSTENPPARGLATGNSGFHNSTKITRCSKHLQEQSILYAHQITSSPFQERIAQTPVVQIPLALDGRVCRCQIRRTQRDGIRVHLGDKVPRVNGEEFASNLERQGVWGLAGERRAEARIDSFQDVGRAADN